MKYSYTFNINGREYERISDRMDTISNLVEKNIQESEVGLFYIDHKTFMDKYVEYRVKGVNKNLYLIITNQSGYDTYDSAVYCAYTEKEAIKMSENRMSYSNEYKNTAELIGTPKEDLEVGEIVSSFNAG